MKIKKVLPRGFGCNSYILTNDDKTAVIIDCAEPSVYSLCAQKGLTPIAVLLTHGHFDHVGGCGEFYLHGVPIYCGEDERELIFDERNRSIFGGVHIPDFKIYKGLKDGEILNVGGMSFKTISTPGHTSGGVSYLVNDSLFTGDTLFYESVGRCDLPTGNKMQLVASVKKLFALDGDYTVYCGHERETTLEHERKFNPYIR